MRSLGFLAPPALQSLTVHFHVGAFFQVIYLCLHNPSFHRAPIQLSAVPGPLATIPYSTCIDEFCRQGAFHFLWCLSHRERLTTTSLLGPSVLKVSNISHPFSTLASSQNSPEIHINVIWAQQSFQFFNIYLYGFSFLQALFCS